MNYKICTILLVVSFLASEAVTNYLVDGVEGDIISGYLLSPVFGPSKIFLTRKSRRQGILHALPIPYAEGSTHVPVFKTPISSNFFQIEDEDIFK